MERVHTYYDNLKVVRTAPTEVIRAAYRAMAQKYHPDLNPASDAARVMKLVNEAWEVLGDPRKRAEHDLWIAKQEQSAQEKTSQGRAQQYTSPFGEGAEFSYRNTGSTHANSATAGNAGDKGPSSRTSASGESSSGRTPPFTDATEGYRAAESNWSRYINGLTQRLKRRFKVKSKPSRKTSFVLILLTAWIAAMWLLPTEKPKQSVQTPFVESNERRDAKLREPRQKIAASQEPRTFTFDPATAKPVDAGLKFVPYDGHVIPLEQRPKNGYLKGTKRLFNNGLSSFTVDNTQGASDAEVRLYTSGVAARSFFVREGTKFTAEKLSPANYTMRYKVVTSGKSRVYMAREVFNVSETETETGTKFSRVTVTLYQVRDGNLKTDEVPEEQF